MELQPRLPKLLSQVKSPSSFHELKICKKPIIYFVSQVGGRYGSLDMVTFTFYS